MTELGCTGFNVDAYPQPTVQPEDRNQLEPSGADSYSEILAFYPNCEDGTFVRAITSPSLLHSSFTLTIVSLFLKGWAATIRFPHFLTRVYVAHLDIRIFGLFRGYLSSFFFFFADSCRSSVISASTVSFRSLPISIGVAPSPYSMAPWPSPCTDPKCHTKSGRRNNGIAKAL